MTDPQEQALISARYPHFALRFGWGQTHQVADLRLLEALHPVAAPPCQRLPFNPLGSVAIGHCVLLHELALHVTRYLPDVCSLDALAAASPGWRAVARSEEAEAALLRRWLPVDNSFASLPTTIDTRSLSRTFERIDSVAALVASGWNAVLWQASALGCLYGVRLALAQGARLDFSGGRNNDEGTALWAAAKFDQLEVVTLLHRAGGDLEAIGGINTRSSPMWVAARQGHARIVRYLLDHGASATVRNRGGHGHSVLDVAMQAVHNQRGAGGGMDMAELLAVLEQL